MPTPKVGCPPAIETRYWKSLTDEQLLETAFRADDPTNLDPTFVSPGSIWTTGVLSSGNVCDRQNK